MNKRERDREIRNAKDAIQVEMLIDIQGNGLEIFKDHLASRMYIDDYDEFKTLLDLGFTGIVRTASGKWEAGWRG